MTWNSGKGKTIWREHETEFLYLFARKWGFDYWISVEIRRSHSAYPHYQRTVHCVSLEDLNTKFTWLKEHSNEYLMEEML